MISIISVNMDKKAVIVIPITDEVVGTVSSVHHNLGNRKVFLLMSEGWELDETTVRANNKSVHFPKTRKMIDSQLIGSSGNVGDTGIDLFKTCSVTAKSKLTKCSIDFA